MRKVVPKFCFERPRHGHLRPESMLGLTSSLERFVTVRHLSLSSYPALLLDNIKAHISEPQRWVTILSA